MDELSLRSREPPIALADDPVQVTGDPRAITTNFQPAVLQRIAHSDDTHGRRPQLKGLHGLDAVTRGREPL